MSLIQQLQSAAMAKEKAIMLEIEAKQNELLEIVSDRCELEFLKEDNILFKIVNTNIAYGNSNRAKTWTERGLEKVFRATFDDIGPFTYADKIQVFALLKTDIEIDKRIWQPYAITR